MESLRAFAGKAFTIFLAGFAATFISFPNIIRLPAFVAALCLTFNVTRCGIVNFSVFFTSALATSTSSANTALTFFGLSSLLTDCLRHVRQVHGPLARLHRPHRLHRLH